MGINLSSKGIKDVAVTVLGSGDLATGVAHRLYRVGFRLMLTELPEPRAVRRTAAFSESIFRGSVTVEGVTAVHAALADIAAEAAATNGERWGGPAIEGKRQLDGSIPVVIDHDGTIAAALNPEVLVDARMAKRNLGTRITDAPVVIGLGPGFTAGVDVHAVVETARGHYLGQVIYHGRAQEFTGVPGEVGGYTVERLLRAPMDGTLRTMAEIGSRVATGQAVAVVAAGAERMPIKAAIPGILRGLLRDGAPVSKGQKIGDVDPRCDPEAVWHISDKARAVGGGVLEAIVCLLWGRPPVAPAGTSDAVGGGEVGREPK